MNSLIIKKILFILVLLCFIPLQGNELEEIDIDLFKNKNNYKKIFFLNTQGQFISFDDANGFMAKVFTFILPPTETSQTLKRYDSFPPFIKIEDKNGNIFYVRFILPLWRWTVSKKDHIFMGEIEHKYMAKLYCLPLKKLAEVTGEQSTPPRLSDAFYPPMKIFLEKYFNDLNQNPYHKKLAYFFEMIGKEKDLGTYSYLQGKTLQDIAYIKNLIVFLENHKKNLVFEDYLCIVYPFHNTESQAPLYRKIPNCKPEDLLAAIKSDKIKEIMIWNMQKKEYFLLNSIKKPLSTIVPFMSEELEPDQVPYLTYILMTVKIKLKIITQNGDSYILGFGHNKKRYQRYWGIYFEKEDQWLFYKILNTPEGIAIFDSVYGELQGFTENIPTNI